MNPFAAFWSDFSQKMASAGVAPAQPPPDMTEHLKKAFFDAMAQYADEFMRSETFLSAMKQSMDNAMAWQNMMNQQMQKGLASAQMPSREDADHTVILIRGMEERLVKKLDDLTHRIEKLEKTGKGKR